MAIDQTVVAPTDVEPPIAAIDNQFPTYRAISALSILSLVLGMGSVFCYADLKFLLVVAASVVTGVLALRKIKRFPDILTGAGYARVGIGLGLLFGATSITQILVQDYMINSDAKQFARHYVEIIREKPISMAIWYQQKPEYRQSKSPDQITEELKKMKGPGSPDIYREKTLSIQQIKERLSGPGEKIQFSKIESTAVDGLTVYANALLELDGPGTKEYPAKEQFALLMLLKGPEGGPDDWIVTDLRFPYTPTSVVATIQKKESDDGHGHSH